MRSPKASQANSDFDDVLSVTFNFVFLYKAIFTNYIVDHQNIRFFI